MYTPKIMLIPDYIEEIERLTKENQELKKQLEELKFDIVDGKPYIKLDTVLTKQQKFIKYLEDESKEIYRDGGLRQNIFRQILQKYKSIIGGKE